MRRGENIYWRKDERWEGRYIKGRKENGKPKYGSVYGKTIQEVREKLYPMKVKYQVILREQGQVTLSFYEWGCRWLREVQKNIKPSTYATYEHKLTNYVLPLIGDCSLNELDETSGEKLLNSLEQRGLKPSTIHAIFRITKQCVNAAIRHKLIKGNPFNMIQLPKIIQNRNQALTRSEQKALEKVAQTEEMGKGVPVMLALHAGLRIGEISALTWENIDFENNMIQVESTVQRVITRLTDKKTELIRSSTKTSSSARIIPMSKKLQKVLLELKKCSTSRYVVSINEKPAEPRLLTYYFHKIRAKVGLSKVNFHRLRHSFATRCLESQGDIMSVSALMGHSSTQMTLDTYAGSMMEQRIQVVAQMEKSIQ